MSCILRGPRLRLVHALVLAAALPGWQAPPAEGGPHPVQAADPSALLDDVRARLRHGLVREAEAGLARLPADAPPAALAGAALLRGNVAFERGDLQGAAAAYEAALARYRQLAGGDAGARTADANLALARDQASRRAMLEGKARRLRLVTSATLAVAACAVVLLARRTARGG